MTEYFEKLIPNDNGLGDYEYPVWFRFLVAGDGCTVLYAAPLPYSPVIYYGYDANESNSKNASMSLEVIPFQDHFSNTLSQIILTAKQNLANLILVDEEQIDKTVIDKIRNLGEKFFRFLNISKFNSKKASRGQNRPADAIQNFTFPKGNVAELTNVLKTILDVLERVLVMSSQEVAQAASHEQTREEIRNISSSTSSRLIFTATPVDIARDAQKRQLYEGLMAYGDDDIYANIPSDIPLSKETLTKMGFTFLDKDEATGKPPRFYRVRIQKGATAIPLWELASNRDNEDRTNNEKLAVTLATILDKLLNNPMLAPAIGPDQAIEAVNALCLLAGLPRDMKFRNAAPPQQQQQQAQEELKQVIETVLGKVNEEMAKAIEPVIEQTKKNAEETKQNSQATDALSAVVTKIIQALQVNPGTPGDDTVTPGTPS